MFSCIPDEFAIFISAEDCGRAEALFSAEFLRRFAGGFDCSAAAFDGAGHSIRIAAGDWFDRRGDCRILHFGFWRFAGADRRASRGFCAVAGADCDEARSAGAGGLCADGGIILIVLGACKLGSLIKYIPFTVVTGFTSGIAIIIMSTQIRDFFGLSEKLPPDFIGKLQLLATHFHPHWPTVMLGMACTLAIWFWPKKLHRVPGSMAIVVLAGVASATFDLKKEELILCGPRSQPLFALTRAGLIDRIGEVNIRGDLYDAIERAKEILAARRG